MKTIIVLIAGIILMTGCASVESHNSKGALVPNPPGLIFTHWNNPECVGVTGSAIVISDEQTGKVIGARIIPKNGYCETVGGHAMQAGSIIVGSYFVAKGIGDSGDRNNTTNNSDNTNRNVSEADVDDLTVSTSNVNTAIDD